MTLLQNYFGKLGSTNPNSATVAYLASLDYLTNAAPEIASSIKQELIDQRSHLKLIASENYCSYAVQLSMGNWMTDKYAEGYPHHRFYAGCDNVDSIEDQAQNELKKLFGCEHAYVQPHSGADANLVALWSILVQKVQSPAIEKLGKKTLEELTPDEYEQIRQLLCNQRLMGMSLNSGGHLTHGYRHNISSKMLQSFQYDVDPKTQLLDYDALAKQAKEVKPLILLAGYSAYPRKLDFAKLREIADSVGAVLMVDMAHFSGLVAGKVFTGVYNPVPYAPILTSTTHKILRGPRGGFILSNKEFADTLDKGCPLVLGGPLPHVMAAKAIAFKEANQPEYRSYAERVVKNAQALAERFKQRGARMVTGGTDNHIVLLDLTQYGLTGRQGEIALREAQLTVNRNSIPNDPQGAWYTSGIRLGTPAMSTLGMGPEEMKIIADVIVDILENTEPAIVEKTGQPSKAKYKIEPSILEKAKGRVKELLTGFPLYPEIELESEQW